MAQVKFDKYSQIFYNDEQMLKKFKLVEHEDERAHKKSKHDKRLRQTTRKVQTLQVCVHANIHIWRRMATKCNKFQ